MTINMNLQLQVQICTLCIYVSFHLSRASDASYIYSTGEALSHRLSCVGLISIRDLRLFAAAIDLLIFFSKCSRKFISCPVRIYFVFFSPSPLFDFSLKR